MLFGNQSISYLSPSNIIIWMIMALQAGLLNIGGLMAGHRIVSHVTGFATFFGYDLASEGNKHPFRILIVPFFFLLGCMLSGYFVDLRLKLNKRPKYYITFGIMFVLTLVVFTGGVSGHFGNFGEPFETNNSYLLLILLSLICGIQNGTISTVSRSVIRTTHLTGITTDLGLGIMRIIYSRRIKEKIPDEGRMNLVRVGIILFFTLGSILGAYLFSYFQFQGFILPAFISGVLFTTMIYFQINPKNLE